MCSSFWQRMERDQGDLGDIIRASGCGSTAAHQMSATDWQLPPEPVSFPSSLEVFNDDYGDSLASFREPLLHELAGSTFFDGMDSAAGLLDVSMVGGDDGSSAVGGGGGSLSAQKTLGGEEIKRPCEIFSRVLQISPRAIKPPQILIGDMVKVNSSVGCPLDQAGLQISSPRTPGIKRRKSQAKKVVCIPAPAAANGRPGGEIVPSDLWAWRKYGQKPIKGSPYPRGYYRCSSSKGCSARKQVERSRTDPNMLVITYTSEHNHPWPTQRNALAGSTRSQPPKSNSSAAQSSPRGQRPRTQGTSNEEIAKGPASMAHPPPIKEEAADQVEKPVDSTAEEQELDQVFDQDYKAMILDPTQPDDFFADLGELESDPLNLVFSKEFLGDKSCDEERENKALDPFNMFDWAGSSFGESRKGGL
ncbi:hypothetical protein Taro_016477 [Colocasia esculenta]|uniref:WRKY domain-containing protein n=1 Tax=Colocasia esculenta TaxID=4460 RepID=A0A843UWD7_COLES|nr:hypothetical protein [Colocasia esculenta]